MSACSEKPSTTATRPWSARGAAHVTKLKRGVDAVALTTDDGHFVAGAGEGVDLEWMGSVGAASPARQLEWGEHQLYVHELEVNDRWLRLTVAGKPLGDHDALGGICRILAT